MSAKQVLETYARLHAGKLGAHWLWVAIERIVAGDSEEEVMRDFGYVPEQGLRKGETPQETRDVYPIPEFLRRGGA